MEEEGVEEEGVGKEGVGGVEGWDMEMLIHKQLVPMVSKDDDTSAKNSLHSYNLVFI